MATIIKLWIVTKFLTKHLKELDTPRDNDHPGTDSETRKGNGYRLDPGQFELVPTYDSYGRLRIVAADKSNRVLKPLIPAEFAVQQTSANLCFLELVGFVDVLQQSPMPGKVLRNLVTLPIVAATRS